MLEIISAVLLFLLLVDEHILEVFSWKNRPCEMLRMRPYSSGTCLFRQEEEGEEGGDDDSEKRQHFSVAHESLTQSSRVESILYLLVYQGWTP